MTQKVRKAVLPVAGLGTRFLPATKAMPKEMLTVVDKPVIQYVVEEALEAGIEEFVFVTGRGKTAIENHFDRPYELADTLQKRGKIKELEAVLNVMPDSAKLYYTRQGQPLGLGHAVNCARSVIGDEPFVVMLPDDLLYSDEANATTELLKTFEETGKSTVLVQEVPTERTNKYGILDLNGGGVKDNRAEVHGFVEKPDPADAPSNLGVVGRYVFTPKIFDYLENAEAGLGGEIQLTDAMDALQKDEGFMGYVYDGQRFDCGDKVGWQQANLHFAMKDEYIAPRLLGFLQQIAEQHDRRAEKRSA